jgi:hypothetical protein
LLRLESTTVVCFVGVAANPVSALLRSEFGDSGGENRRKGESCWAEMGTRRKGAGCRLGDFDTGGSLARGNIAQDDDGVNKINSSKMGIEGQGGENGEN